MNGIKSEHVKIGRSIQKRNQIIYFTGLTTFVFIWLIPILWTISLSFRTEASIQQDLTRILPIPFTLEHYQSMLSNGQMVRWLLNSLIVAGSRTVLQLFVCSLAAYAFARINFKGKRFLYPLALIGLMVPFQAIFIPLYLIFAQFQLHNTYIALILPGIASSFAIFLLFQFFQGIPRDLEEAAFLDGASRFVVYWRVIMPLSTPILTALSIFIFLGTWNEYLWPLVSATDDQMLTITIGLRKLSQIVGGHEAPKYGAQMAAAWVGGLPILIFFLIFQSRIISGIQLTSGIKGG